MKHHDGSKYTEGMYMYFKQGEAYTGGQQQQWQIQTACLTQQRWDLFIETLRLSSNPFMEKNLQNVSK